MKTATSAALLVVLAALALTLTAEAKKKNAGAAESAGDEAETKKLLDYCGTRCRDSTRGKKAFLMCTEQCALSQRNNLVLYGRVQCRGKCTEQKGITAPAMVTCEEQCDKDYRVKAAEVTADCNKACDKEEEEINKRNCKNSCTPPTI